MDWDDGLTGVTLNIAREENSPLRVVAGPGTGKTFAIMRRVARLLQTGVCPSSIFLCSFTRTAATDLAKELQRLGSSGADEVRASTLHSYCFAILGQSDVLSITGRVPRPMLKIEERFLVEDLKSDIFGGVTDCQKRNIAFSADWARLQHEQPGWCSDPVDKAYHAALIAWLRFHRAMLIGELVPESLKYLRLNPASSHRVQFQHVLVDEYQDLNRAEQDFVGMLAEGAKYSVVGDDDQSIYSFKHAHPEGIIEFPRRYVGTHNEELSECRRCPTKVVEMANNLILHNRVRSNRRLQPRAGNPLGEVYLVQWLSMVQEATGVAKFVKKKIADEEVKPGEVLILAPRREFGYEVRDELCNEGLTAHSFFSEELFSGDVTKKNGCEALDPYALLCLLANPEDRVALRVWCGAGHADLRRDLWALIRSHCEATGKSPRELLDEMLAGNVTLEASTRSVSGLLDRFRLLKDQLAVLGTLRGKDLFRMLFPVGAEWAEPLQALCDQIENDCLPDDIFELVGSHIAQPDLPVDVDYVRVMSLHKSKGLTAKMVVVTGCIEGILPSVKESLPPVDQERMLEEQRRLMYVAITRTTSILMLSSVLSLPRKVAFGMGANVSSSRGADSFTISSRFWQELGPAAPMPILGTQLP